MCKVVQLTQLKCTHYFLKFPKIKIISRRLRFRIYHANQSSYQNNLFRSLKLKFRKYPSIHTNYIISHATILQYNHNIWYGSYAEKKYWARKTMISTGLPYLQFSMNSQGFSPARLTWPAYDGGRKRENSSAWNETRLKTSHYCCIHM